MRHTVPILAVLALVSALAVVPLGAQEKRLGASPVPAPLGATLSYGHTGPGQAADDATFVDLSPWFPGPGSQGLLNSCVAWASAYAIKSYHEQSETGDNFGSGSKIFSPSFIYNQINKGKDEGSTLVDAATTLKNIGAVTMDVMPYTTDYRKQPSKDQLSKAAPFRIQSFSMVKPNDVEAMKAYLRQGKPVLIGMMIYSNFEDYSGGVYTRTSGQLLGGHAMTVLGYDDSRKALRLINSWGTDWGDKGYAWVGYDVFRQINKDALVMTDIQALPSPSLPQAPTGVQAGKGLSTDQVEVIWNPVPGADSYDVYRSLQPAEDYRLAAKVRGTTWLDKDVEESTMYYYAIRTVVGSQTSPWSEAAQGFLQTVPGLGVVQGLQAVWKDNRVLLSWLPVEGAKGYHIYRYLPEQDLFGRIGSSADQGFADASLKDKPGTYYYLVSAWNDTKEGPNSSAVSLQVPTVPLQPLVSPKGLSASQGTFPDRVEVKWQAVPGAQQYVILRYDMAREVWKIMAGTKATTWTDKDASATETYYAVLSRVGDTTSELGDYVAGYKGKPKAAKASYADDGYYETKKKAREGTADSLFRNDSFFTSPKDFFKDFAPQDFFFVDEAKFFAVDPDFFIKPTDLFMTPEKLFD